MRPLAGVLAILLIAALPLAAAQGTKATTLTISGAGPVLDLTESPTRTVVLPVQLTVEQGFTCTGAATLTVTVNVTTTGPLTAALDNTTLTYNIPAGHSPLQPYKGEATTTLTVTRTAAHQEAEALVVADYAGGTVSGCVPSAFAPTNASVPVRTTSLAGGAGGGATNAANITIVSPAANAEGAEFNVVVSVSNFDLKPVPTSPGVVAGQGHIHYLVDGKPAAGEYATAAKNFTFRGLAAGEHTLRAELVNNDHTPLNPPVFHEVKVKATGASPTPTTRPVTPTPVTGATPATPTNTVGQDGGEEEEDDGNMLPGPGVVALALAATGAALVLRRRG